MPCTCSETPAADRLVVAYMPLARRLAKILWHTLPHWVSRDEIESDALLGLLKAARSFDPDRKVVFESFATPRIRGAMLDGLRERLGRYRSSRRANLQSLDSPGFAEGGNCLSDTLPDDSPSIEQDLAKRDEVNFLLSHLSESDRSVLETYYLKGLLQREIAAAEKVTTQTIGMRLRMAKSRLRQSLQTEQEGSNHG